MLIIAKTSFYDDNGIHAKGEAVNVKTFDPVLHELPEETAPETTSEEKPTRGRKRKE